MRGQEMIYPEPRVDRDEANGSEIPWRRFGNRQKLESNHKCRFAMEGRRCAAGNSSKCGEKMGRFGGQVSGGVWVIFTLDAEMNGRGKGRSQHGGKRDADDPRGSTVKRSLSRQPTLENAEARAGPSTSQSQRFGHHHARAEDGAWVGMCRSRLPGWFEGPETAEHMGGGVLADREHALRKLRDGEAVSRVTREGA
jgi:hypothetical protein